LRKATTVILMCRRALEEQGIMSDKWEIEGVRGELTNDTVFIRETETGQRESVTTSNTNDTEQRNQEVGEKIANGDFNKK
jgi:hypothetical protein